MATTEQTECPICGYESSEKGVNIHKTKVHESKEASLLEAIRQLADGQERPPSAHQMRKEGPFSIDVYQSVFGGWPEALEAAGLERNPDYYERIPKKALLAEIGRLAEKLGKRPYQEDMVEQGKFSLRPYINRFGSWGKALEEAGYDPTTNPNAQIADSKLLEDLRRVTSKLGHAPTVPEYREHGRYHDDTYWQRFDSWIDAQQAAGLEPTRAKPGEGTKSGRYKGNWESARENALRRDQYRCQDCGQTNAEHREEVGRALDVHHIEPYQSFDEPETANELGNLVSLCRECHRSRHAVE